jgi:hypothetical protein
VTGEAGGTGKAAQLSDTGKWIVLFRPPDGRAAAENFFRLPPIATCSF